jgi:hypothetical protein
MKIKAKPEGREGLYVVEKKDITEWLNQYPFNEIHNFIAGRAIIGADWSKQAVIDKINEDTDSLVAIATGKTKSNNMGHALALATDRLYLFDIGDITDADIELEV